MTSNPHTDPSPSSTNTQLHASHHSSAPANHNNSSNSNTSSSTSTLLLPKLRALSIQGPQRLILASKSPRRREILDMMGLANRYTVTVSPLDEEALQMELARHSISPAMYAQKLAESKAHALARHMALNCLSSSGMDGPEHSEEEDGSCFILGSDTIVDKEGVILEKPKNEQDARRMLTMLSGTWHEVHTGVAIYKMKYPKGGVNNDDDDEMDNDGNQNGDERIIALVSSFTETARVKFTTLSEEDIQAYIDTGEPMDKAGGYGIQGMGGQLVERMEGDFFAVMGLPMHRLSSELAKALLEKE